MVHQTKLRIVTLICLLVTCLITLQFLVVLICLFVATATKQNRISDSDSSVSLSNFNFPSLSNVNQNNINICTIESMTNNAASVDMFAQLMIEEQNHLKQFEDYKQKILKQYYPVKFLIGHVVVVGAICASLIVLQIFMIINQYAGYNTGEGIWVSVYFIIAISLEIYSSKFNSIHVRIKSTFMIFIYCTF